MTIHWIPAFAGMTGLKKLFMNLNNFGVVILSAGKGTRLGCTDKPKVMLEIGGKPIVSYLVETLKNMAISSISGNP